MKVRFFLILALSVCALAASAQKIDKYYVSKLQDSGTLYHVFPMELFSDGHNAVPVDFTHLSDSDTVKINYTLQLDRVCHIDSVAFVCGDARRVYPTEKIYVEAAKKTDWAHRYTVSMTIDEVEAIFVPEAPAGMIVYSDGAETSYNASRKQWKNDTTVLCRIVTMMRENR